MRLHERIGAMPAVDSVARPWIGKRPADHPRADWIELDISIAGQNVPRRLRHAGPETALPKGACPLVPSIEILDIALTKISHEVGARFPGRRGEQEVNVVGHQAKSM